MRRNSLTFLTAMFAGPLSLKAVWKRIKHLAEAYYEGASDALAWLMVMMSGLGLLHPAIITDIIGLFLVALGLLSQKYLPPVPIIGIRPFTQSQNRPEPP